MQPCAATMLLPTAADLLTCNPCSFGLTAAAEALCAQLHLPDQTCIDLWRVCGSTERLLGLPAREGCLPGLQTAAAAARVPPLTGPAHPPLCRWGAFALALVLSLGAAVPIVNFCRLPECGRHAAAAVLARGAAVARALA